MPCQTTTPGSVDSIRTCLENLGFALVREISTTQLYRYQQYTLRFNTQTFKLECWYGFAERVFDYAFVSIIQNCSEIEVYLRRNGVIN